MSVVSKAAARSFSLSPFLFPLPVGDTHAQFYRPSTDQTRGECLQCTQTTRIAAQCTRCNAYIRTLLHSRSHSLALAHSLIHSLHHFRPFTTECNFVPRRHTATQHPARQITALFALAGTSKRNKDLGTDVSRSCRREIE